MRKKLSDADVAAIRESTDPPAVLAQRYPVSEWYIYEIRAGRVRNKEGRRVQPPRQTNTKSERTLLGLGCCKICGAKLHQHNITTDGNGYELEFCDNGHRILRA